MTALRPLAEIADAMTFGREPRQVLDIGIKGELRWLKLEQLVIDPAYQREILDAGKANIRRIVEEFSWLLFGVLIVGKRPGNVFAIIDGQHRAVGAYLHGAVTEVPCLVLTGGISDEARAFAAINGNVTRIHPLQSFRAKVVAGDEDACELIEVCRTAGVSIAPYPKGDLLPGETMALNTIRVAIRRHTEPAALAGLRLLRAADPGLGIAAPSILAAAHAMQGAPELRKQAKEIGRELHARGGVDRPMRTKAQARKLSRGGPEWANLAAVLADAIRMAIATPDALRARRMAGR